MAYKKVNRWKLTRINQSFMMSRLDYYTNTIEVRPLNCLEKVIYWWRKRNANQNNI